MKCTFPGPVRRPSDPGVSISRKSTQEGAPVTCASSFQDYDLPRLHAFSIDTSDCCPLFRSSCRGTSYTAPASSTCPRRASDLLGAERCDPQPSQALRCHAADTPHRADEAVRTFCSPVSILNHILLLQQTVFLPGASSCVSHSTAVPALPVPHSRGACMVLLVSLASDHLPFSCHSPATFLPQCKSGNPHKYSLFSSFLFLGQVVARKNIKSL